MPTYSFTFEDRKAKTTLIAFSGLAKKNNLFEWLKSSLGWEVNFVGIRDNTNSWYQNDKEELFIHLQGIIFGLENYLFLGGSAGGFAALYYGRQLDAKTLAFCPQSACGEAKNQLGDDRWNLDFPNVPSFDLGLCSFPNATIHYSEDDPLDALHAERLDAKEKISWKYTDHDLPRYLKKKNLLPIILRGSL